MSSMSSFWVCGSAAAERVGLDVLVQELGRVELGAVAGQELQLDLIGVGLDPAFRPSRRGGRGARRGSG